MPVIAEVRDYQDELTALRRDIHAHPELAFAERRIGEIARGVASVHGAVAEADYRRSYPPTINHPAETEFAAQVAAEICGPDAVLRDIAPSMGGEDFSFMLNARPGAMLWLGNGPGEGDCFLHNARY